MKMKRQNNALRRVLGPHRQMFGVLTAADSLVPEQQVQAYFRNLVQHLGNPLKRLELYLRNLLPHPALGQPGCS